ncbi:succinyl-diaminopimelate desuccinylase [Insolitispirillum peregrinum]|uniref:succinyl-diaminopimelate desuccinylase n=1 Tax=Insolitispirillum peregrinum TaxID=80876 RepID=UPI000970DE3A|nr:succinyl-diaminopimelate desuccinylase [Insolitispirillum peregrinum]
MVLPADLSLTDPLLLAQALIRCPSVTPDDAGAIAVLETALTRLGFRCHRLTFSADGTPDIVNLYARRGEQGRNLCFAGHTDVVPPGNGWSRDPFAAEVVDGVLYGRGANDMKAAIAAFVAACARRLQAHDGSLPGSLSLLITGDEEGPAINGTVKVLGWLAEQNETLDACVVGEPTNPRTLGEMVKIGRRGSLNGCLTVWGSQGHVAYPHLADNPIPRLVALVQALIGTPIDQGSSHFQASNLEITSIDVGNMATNVIPAKAEARFNVRFNDLWSGETLEAHLRQRLQAVCDDPALWDLAISVSGESFLTQPGPFTGVVEQAIRSVTGLSPDLSTTGGTSDARFIKNACPVLEFGLVGQTMHKANENCSVADLEALTSIYERVIDGYFACKA